MSNIEITISIKVSVNYLHPSNKSISLIIKQVGDNTFFILDLLYAHYFSLIISLPRTKKRESQHPQFYQHHACLHPLLSYRYTRADLLCSLFSCSLSQPQRSRLTANANVAMPEKYSRDLRMLSSPGHLSVP